MALILGAFMIHGITPGPSLMTAQPDLFWGLIVSFWIGNLLLLILNVPLIRIWVALLQIPYRYLYPAIITLICVGVYSLDRSTFDVFLVLGLGIFGYIMRLLDFEPATLLLGFVLGPLMEENFRRALVISRGDYGIFLDRPISGVVLFLALMMLVWTLWRGLRDRRAGIDPRGET